MQLCKSLGRDMIFESMITLWFWKTRHNAFSFQRSMRNIYSFIRYSVPCPRLVYSTNIEVRSFSVDAKQEFVSQVATRFGIKSSEDWYTVTSKKIKEVSS